MLKSKKFNKCKKIVSVICLSAILVGTQQYLAAYAADYADKPWKYSVGGDKDDTRYTDPRTKYTESSVYCKVESFTENFHKDANVLRATIVDSDNQLFSKTSTKTIDRVGEYAIVNFAYEENNCKVDAKIKFWSRDWRAFYTWGANGQWSPDCYGNIN